MGIDNKAVEALTSFGLTEYEAKVYLALVTKGTQKASALADVSNIPRPHVYSVIKLLHEKGLITIIPEKVNKYQAQPPDVVFKKLIEDRAESIRSLENIARTLTENLKGKKGSEEEDSGEKVILYHGRWSIVNLMREMMGRARNTCIFITNDPGYVFTLHMFEYELKELKKRGIEVLFLMPIQKDTLGGIGKLSGFASIRHLDSMEMTGRIEAMNHHIHNDPGSFLRVMVVDSSEVLFKKSTSEGDMSAIWTSQKEMADMINLMFRHMWQSAPDLRTKAIELEMGKKPERLSPIYSDPEIEKSYSGIFSRSRNAVCCVLSQEQLIYGLRTFISEVKALSSRGVRAKFLVSIRSDVTDTGRARLLANNSGEIAGAVRALESLGAEVRHPASNSILKMVMSDDEVVFNLVADSTASVTSNGIGVYTNHRDTIDRIREYFDGLWESSIEARLRLNEIDRYMSKGVMRDGLDGLKKYFKRLSELGLGNFAIKSSDPVSKKIVIMCTDDAESRSSMKSRGNVKEDICVSGKEALKSFAKYVYDGTKMDCKEIKCIDNGDEHCEFMLYPAEEDAAAKSNELLKFFESIKTPRVR